MPGAEHPRAFGGTEAQKRPSDPALSQHSSGGRLSSEGRTSLITLGVILGLIGGIAAIAGVWSLFIDWLNLLGILVPPIGAIIITDKIVLRHYSIVQNVPNFRPSAFVAWAMGAAAAIAVHYMAPFFPEAIAGLFVSAASYFFLADKSEVPARFNAVA
jgi:purine-cytosine permease-like protein